MKRLEEIKDEYAKKLGYSFDNWNDLVDYFVYWDQGKLHNCIDDVMKEFALEVAKEALDNAYESTKNTLQEFAFKREGQLSKCLSESILSHDNILEL